MKYFGTDGFRGKANESLTVEHALKIGQFLGWYFGARNGKAARCVIGKDTRRSSYMLEYGLSAGLTSSGADVFLMHVTTTPSVSYITKSEDFDFGIMITASHNPYYDNGIKIIDSEGYKMSEDVLIEVEKYIDGEIHIPVTTKIGRCQDFLQGRNKYISYLSSIPKYSFRGYKIGLDCANGSASTVAKMVFDMLGADTYVINNQPDGYNINVDAGSTHIDILKDYVIEHGLDMGFAFDGDADRCIAVDERGNVVDGDGIIYIASLYLKEKDALVDDTAVVTVMSNLGLFNALKENDIKVLTTDVGDKYISAEIQQNGYSVGGEQSGHVIFSRYSVTGDGILTAIILANIVIEKKALFSGLTRGLKILPQKLKNIKTEHKNEIMVKQEVIDYTKKVNDELNGKGRILIRKSGTEPLIRIMTEAGSDEECDEIIARAEEFLKQYL